jgi:hypothetical protein
MDTAFKGLEKRGFQVQLPLAGEGRAQVRVLAHGQEVEFRLKERTKRVERGLTSSERIFYCRENTRTSATPSCVLKSMNTRWSLEAGSLLTVNGSDLGIS